MAARVLVVPVEMGRSGRVPDVCWVEPQRDLRRFDTGCVKRHKVKAVCQASDLSNGVDGVSTWGDEKGFLEPFAGRLARHGLVLSTSSLRRL